MNIRSKIFSLILILLFSISSAQAQRKLILYSDFENNSTAPNTAISNWDQAGKTDSSVIVTTERARRGNKSVKFTFSYKEWYPKNSPKSNDRAEIIAKRPLRPEGMTLGKKWWAGFSEYFPIDWINDYPENPEIIWQFHGGTWGGLIGPSAGSPPLSASIFGNEIRISLQMARDINTYSVNGNSTKVLASFPLIKGKWIDWVVMTKLDYTNGLAKIWSDGKLIVDYKGPTLYHTAGQNSELGAYFRIGDYKWPWGHTPTKVTRRVMYADEIRIGDSTADYDDVKPGQDPAPFTVVAKGTPAAGKYPHFSVLANGKVVGSAYVTGEYKKYTFPSSLFGIYLQSVVVQFDNPVLKNNEHRTLFVKSVQAGGMEMKAKHPGGAPIANKQLSNQLNEQDSLLTKGSLVFRLHPAASITITAKGTSAGGIYAHFKVLANGKVVGSAYAEKDYKKFIFYPSVEKSNIHSIIIQYDNDSAINTEDRNLFVHCVQFGEIVMGADDPGVVFDRNARDGFDLLKGQENLMWNGSLIFTLP